MSRGQPNSPSEPNGEIDIDWAYREVPLKLLHENDYNPRSTIDDVSDITSSIEKAGIRGQLMEVRDVENGYEVITGSRRLSAFRERYGRDNDKEMPVYDAGCISRNDAKWLAMTENTNRRDLDPMDEARMYGDRIWVNGDTYSEYVEKLPHSIDESKTRVYIPSESDSDVQSLANDTPNSASTITNRISLLLLPERMYEWIDNYSVSEDIYPQLPMTAVVRIIAICRSKVDDPSVSLDLIEWAANDVAAKSMGENTTSNRMELESVVGQKIDEMNVVDAIRGDDNDVDLDEMITTEVGENSTVSEETGGVDFNALATAGDVEVSNSRVVIDSESMEQMGHECPLCHREYDGDHHKETVAERLEDSEIASLDEFIEMED